MAPKCVDGFVRREHDGESTILVNGSATTESYVDQSQGLATPNCYAVFSSDGTMVRPLRPPLPILLHVRLPTKLTTIVNPVSSHGQIDHRMARGAALSSRSRRARCSSGCPCRPLRAAHRGTQQRAHPLQLLKAWPTRVPAGLLDVELPLPRMSLGPRWGVEHATEWVKPPSRR
jgi:hypothetical protein